MITYMSSVIVIVSVFNRHFKQCFIPASDYVTTYEVSRNVSSQATKSLPPFVEWAESEICNHGDLDMRKHTHTHTVASWKGHCGGNGGVWNFMCAIHVDFGLHGRQVQLSTRDFTYAGTRSSCNNNVVVSPRNLSLEDLRIQSSSPFRLPKHCMLKGWKSLGCFDPEVLCAGFYFSCNLGLHQHLLCAKGAHAIRYDQMLGSNEDEIKPEPTSRNEIQGKPWSMPPRGWQYQNLGWLLQLCGQIQIVMYDLASPPLTNGNIACGVATQCEPSPLFIRASNDVIQGRVNHEWYQLPLINSIRWWSPSK